MSNMENFCKYHACANNISGYCNLGIPRTNDDKYLDGVCSFCDEPDEEDCNEETLFEIFVKHMKQFVEEAEEKGLIE